MSALIRATLVVTLIAPAALAQDTIAWSKDLTTAFVDGKAQKKIIMICVNAKYVDGKKIEERANKGLREVVYKDARIVAKSRAFVCAMITPTSNVEDFKELRMIGVGGVIIAPQHIFVHPSGEKILVRKQYWSHGKGDAAVNVLLAMMAEAEKKLTEPDAPAAKNAGANDAPSGDARPAWINERIQEVVAGPQPDRKQAIVLLMRNDKDGDCTTPLIALLAEHKKNAELLVEVTRGLGRDKLEAAALPIAALLTHKEDDVRGNAAVSLEYIGSRDKKVTAALRKAAGKEKNENIANHLCRALGRCGVGDATTRSFLLKRATGGKTEHATFGPAIGLAYFEGDAKAARGVEKILKKIGVPGGRRGGDGNTVRRGVICWTLASIGDYESGTFIQEELISKLDNMKAFWVEGLKRFYRSVALQCKGKGRGMEAITQGVQGFVGFAKGANAEKYDVEARSMMDAYRKDRDGGEFTPKGDGLLGGSGDT